MLTSHQSRTERPLIGTILNHIRPARERELRELTADALAEAQLQSYALHAIEEAHRVAHSSG